MGLFKFYWTDAIANASGTTIRYADVNNGTDVTSYGNIIGYLILETISNSTEPIIVHTSGVKVAGCRIGANLPNISANDKIKIRVFYF